MSGPIHVDGELVDRDGRHLSALDRGFRYGDAVFETMRAYGGSIFAWERHLDRLERSATTVGLDHGLSRTDLRGRAEETLAANDLTDAYLRLSISRGIQPGTLTPQPTTNPTVVVQVEALPRGGVEGEPVWDGPARCHIPDIRRMPTSVIPAHVKSHNYLNGILASQAADDAGAEVAVLLDMSGNVTEATTANLFFVRGGTLHTPSVDALPVLPGITREEVITIAERHDIPIETGVYDPGVLAKASEAFLTNTTWEVRPIDSIDDMTFSVGPVTRTLADAFSRLIERRCY